MKKLEGERLAKVCERVYASSGEKSDGGPGKIFGRGSVVKSRPPAICGLMPLSGRKPI